MQREDGGRKKNDGRSVFGCYMEYIMCREMVKPLQSLSIVLPMLSDKNLPDAGARMKRDLKF